MVSETVHLCPPEGSGLMPCCNRTPFEVGSSERMTLDPALVTCTKETAMTLRDQCVEAAAKAGYESMFIGPPLAEQSEVEQSLWLRVASAAFDAVLDVLAENADEWFDLWTSWSDPVDGHPKFVGLVKVLREGRSTGNPTPPPGMRSIDEAIDVAVRAHVENRCAICGEFLDERHERPGQTHGIDLSGPGHPEPEKNAIQDDSR